MPKPTEDEQKATHAAGWLLQTLDQAARKGFFGEVSVVVKLENGRIQTYETLTRKSHK